MALCGIAIAALLAHSPVKVNLHIGSYARSHTVGPLSPLSPSHGPFRGYTRLA